MSQDFNDVPIEEENWLRKEYASNKLDLVFTAIDVNLMGSFMPVYVYRHHWNFLEFHQQVLL